MNRQPRRAAPPSVVALALVFAMLSASCRKGSLPPLADDAEVADAARAGAPLPLASPIIQRLPARTIRMDGQFDDWADLPAVARGRSTYPGKAFIELGRVWCALDDRWVYLRFELGRTVSMHGLTGTLSIQLDADGNPLTGDIRTAGEGEPGMAGVDFELHFSPRLPEGGFGGVSAEVVEAGLPTAPASPYWFEALVAPTWASREVEMRLARGGLIPGATVSPFASAHFTARLIFSDETGSIVDRTDAFSIALPPLPQSPIDLDADVTAIPDAQEGEAALPPPEDPAALDDAADASPESAATDPAPTGAAEDAPASEDSTEHIAAQDPAAPASQRLPRFDRRDVRAVSWSMSQGEIFANPEPFARILAALHPDVICLQELGADASEAALKAWLDERLPSAYGWEVMLEAGTGCAVASRLAAVRVRPGATEETAAPGIAASSLLVAAANRRVLITSMRFQRGGRIGDASDFKRIEEAGAVRRLLRAGQFELAPSGLLLMGDLNLVGSFEPLKVIRHQNDLNATDLLVVDAMVWGDESNATWRDASQPFLPGRLDYALLSDSVLTLSRSLVFDTERLSEADLARLGVRREDSRASDHLPVVVDFR